MSVDGLKREYNRTLERFNKGSVYMDDPRISLDAKEKALPAFMKILQNLCSIERELKQLGVIGTDEEYRNGFMTGGENDE
jgi:hypothetical protein